MRLSVFAISLLLLAEPVPPAGAGEQTQRQAAAREAPAGEELAQYTVVRLSYAADKEFAGWQLAHALQYGAEGAGATVKRAYWHALAEAFESVGTTGEGKVEARRVGHHEVLISKNPSADGSTVVAVLYLSEGVLVPQQGKLTVQVDTSFTRSRNTTQEVTTWPISGSLAFVNEFNEDRSFELDAAYHHTRITQKIRPAFRDQNGDVISFDGIPSVAIQDTRDAALDLAYVMALKHQSGLGRVDLALTGGGGWERDEINLLEGRLTPYAGAELRFTSESISDLGMYVGFNVAGNFERWIIIDTITDEGGNVIATEQHTEETRLPSLEGLIGGTAPLYRLDDVTMILFEGEASVMQSFSQGGDSQSERLGHLQVGLRFQTPIGASLGIQQKLEWLRLPGEAANRIDSFQWDASAVLSIKLVF